MSRLATVLVLLSISWSAFARPSVAYNIAASELPSALSRASERFEDLKWKLDIDDGAYSAAHNGLILPRTKYSIPDLSVQKTEEAMRSDLATFENIIEDLEWQLEIMVPFEKIMVPIEK